MKKSLKKSLKNLLFTILGVVSGAFLAFLTNEFTGAFGDTFPVWQEIKCDYESYRYSSGSDSAFVILLAELERDKSRQQISHIKRTLEPSVDEGIFDVKTYCRILRIPDGDLRISKNKAVAKAKTWLREENADVLIWGEYVEDRGVVHLRFTSVFADSNNAGESFELSDSSTVLPENFDAALVTAVHALALVASESAGGDRGAFLIEQLEPVARKMEALFRAEKRFTGSQLVQLRLAYANTAWVLGEQTGRSVWSAKSAKAYSDVLDKLDKNKQAGDWAKIALLRGMALLDLGTVLAGDERLEESLDSLNQSLEVFNSNDYPKNWLRTMNVKGIVLRELGERRQDVDLLDQAISALNSVVPKLSAAGPEKMKWGAVQNNLADAKSAKAELTLDQLNEKTRPELLPLIKLSLTESVVHYQNALRVFDKSNAPAHWATVHDNMGINYRVLGLLEQDPELLKQSLIHLFSALSMRERHGNTVDHGSTLFHISETYTDMFILLKQRTLLGNAERYLRNALRIFEELGAAHHRRIAEQLLAKIQSLAE